jgi:hypothetical protein
MAPSLVVESSDVGQLLRPQDVGVTWIEGKRVVPALPPYLRSLYPDALHGASLVPVGCQGFEVVPMAGDAPPAPHPHLAASVVPTDALRRSIRCRRLRARPAVAELGTDRDFAESVQRVLRCFGHRERVDYPHHASTGPWRLEIVGLRASCDSWNAGDPDLMERGSLGRKFARISRGASQARQSDQARSDQRSIRRANSSRMVAAWRRPGEATAMPRRGDWGGRGRAGSGS